MSKEIDPKLMKIVALAKQGVGGEKEAADRMVRAACKRLDLDYDEVMNENETYREYVLSVHYKTYGELRILAQVCWRFGDTGNPAVKVFYDNYRKVVLVTTTPGRFVEVEQAAAVYLRAYRKQRKEIIEALTAAFIQKNRLFSEFPDEPKEDAPRPEQTAEERAAAWRRAQLYEALEPVKYRKSIEAPKS